MRARGKLALLAPFNMPPRESDMALFLIKSHLQRVGDLPILKSAKGATLHPRRGSKLGRCALDGCRAITKCGQRAATHDPRHAVARTSRILCVDIKWHLGRTSIRWLQHYEICRPRSLILAHDPVVVDFVCFVIVVSELARPVLSALLAVPSVQAVLPIIWARPT
jgi:hypothetical protein